MCGIVGIASCEPVLSHGWLARGSVAICHRGPDDEGEWWEGDRRVGLGHRRLAIVDLTPAGHQPMRSGDTTIAFNGEIYNYRELREELLAMGFAFASQSDTEVALSAYKAWGRDCIDRLQGMFAFALYDAEQEVLLLARDRAGEKPLFYHFSSGCLRFASELKALLADPGLPRRLSSAGLNSYLSNGYVSGDACLLEGFSKLPPAHAMTFHLRSGETRIWRYWSVPGFDDCEGALEDEHLVDDLDGLLEQAVRRQLVADVPVGVLLSGGVDSSLVTAMAARATRLVKTFNIRFPGHGKLDETEHARLIARHFGTEHVELEAEATSAALLPLLARQFDEPIIDSSMIPTFLVSRLVRQHCTVALGGDGGDELFGGYKHYPRLLRLAQNVNWAPPLLRRHLALVAGRCLPTGFKGRNWLQAAGVDFSSAIPHIATYFDAAGRMDLLGPDWLRLEAASLAQAGQWANGDLLQRATRMDFFNYLAEDILVKVDRASMLNSLEIRAPFLDRDVIEFAFRRIPSRLKATSSDRKVLLKRLSQKVLPPKFDRQRKQGFSIPLADWLRAGEFRDMFRSVLLDKACMFDRKAIEKLLLGQDRGLDNGERLFGLVLFELWRHEYQITC